MTEMSRGGEGIESVWNMMEGALLIQRYQPKSTEGEKKHRYSISLNYIIT
jgi:hypothetical protein